MDVKLVMFKSNGHRKEFSVTNAATVIGRGEDCDLQVPLASVSRRHCQLVLDADGLTVNDLSSANGTYVNNTRVATGPLKAGDRLVLGPVVFTVQIDGMPQDIKPVRTRGQIMAGAGAPAEGVVELEPDVSAGVHDEAQALAASAAFAQEDIDPISALEALAAESNKEEEQEGEKKKKKR